MSHLRRVIHSSIGSKGTEMIDSAPLSTILSHLGSLVSDDLYDLYLITEIFSKGSLEPAGYDPYRSILHKCR